MPYIGLLLITAFNGVVVFVVGVLAVGGDGSSDGVQKVWLFGTLWVALFSATAIVLLGRGKSGTAIMTAAAAVPTAVATAMAMSVAGYTLGQLRPNSSELEAACKTAEVTFSAKPKLAVNSIAYDWGRKYPVEINFLEVSDGYRLSNFQTLNPPYPPQIAFIEKVTTEVHSDGTKSTTIIRIPRDGKGTFEPALAADVLVSYKYVVGKEELAKALTQQGLVGYEVTVTDRRDDRELAKLRYFTELARRRGCGPAGTRVLGIQSFVLKALEVQ